MGDIHIFGNRDACRHVIALQDLVGAGAQDCPEDRIDACEPPAFCQLLIDQRIDLELFAHHALDEIAEEGCLGVALLAVLDVLAETLGFELGDHLVQVDAGHVHLIERLDRGEPGCAAGRCAGLRFASPGHGG